MREIPYIRENAVEYARRWALDRNPRYLNFSGIGGDCANFASQCLHAGGAVMNYKALYGWYYNSGNDRAPAWSSVKYLHRFLTNNKEAGPYAVEARITDMMPGDIIQIASYMEEYHHTLVVLEAGAIPDADNILIAAHSYDTVERPLSSYDIKKIRFMHIAGIRAWS